jgi:hypothetical protein
MASPSNATELPGQLSGDNIKYASEVMGFGTNHRPWTAPAIPSEGLGLDLGLESAFVFRRDLENIGNGQGVVPRIVPVPRFWAAWDLPRDIQVSASLAPGWLFDGVTSVGFGGQWVFARDEEIRTNFSALMTYTFADSFDDMRTHVTGLAAQAARDMESWQPYIGLGMLVANGTVKNNRQAPTVDAGPYTSPAIHVFVGLNLNILGKFSLQLDIANRYISAGLLLAQKF